MEFNKVNYQTSVCSGHDLSDKLKEFGDCGWTLVSMTENNDKYTLVFKR